MEFLFILHFKTVITMKWFLLLKARSVLTVTVMKPNKCYVPHSTNRPLLIALHVHFSHASYGLSLKETFLRIVGADDLPSFTASC